MTIRLALAAAAAAAVFGSGAPAARAQALQERNMPLAAVTKPTQESAAKHATTPDVKMPETFYTSQWESISNVSNFSMPNDHIYGTEEDAKWAAYRGGSIS